MRVSFILNERGNVLLCAICTIFVVSLIAANVLLNCTARYNQASNQVRSWNEALYAAESGGDIAYNEARKLASDSTNAFSASNGWTTSTNPDGSKTYTSGTTTVGTNGLRMSQSVKTFYPDTSGNAWCRIRSKGTSPLQGLKRTGMDDRLSNGNRFSANGATRGDGDTLLRKIDFKYDHFTATYGDWFTGDSTKTIVAVSPAPQLSRRIELIASPITPFDDVAIKVTGNFYGLGSAAYIDSYRSSAGPYDPSVKTNPSDPRYVDSQSGSVQIDNATATVMGDIYGNLYTNGGTATKKTLNVHGTIDNNVPFTLPSFTMPTNLPAPQASPTNINSNITVTPTGTAQTPTVYLLSSFTKQLTINQNGSSQTYVAIHLTSDFTGKIDVKPGVHVQFFINGNVDVKAEDLVNETGYAGNLQFYSISPTDGSPQHVNINSPGNLMATFYAPGADFTMNGNPDVIGAVIAKSFYGNGNTSWHYDRSLDSLGEPTDYRIASYVEDIR